MSLLELRNVTKVFGGVVAMDKLSFKVEKGDIYGIIGPNGAGKTTAFNCITGIYKPEEGEIIWKGENIAGMHPCDIAGKGIVRTFQNIRLFGKMSVAENIISGRHQKSKQSWLQGLLSTPFYRKDEKENWLKVKDIMKIMGLSEYATIPTQSLAYGIQRRVEIGRALATEPELLILDEPAAGLNEKETLELMELINRIKDEGITILLIEHDMDMVMKLVNKITVINFGKKISEGDPEYIQNDPVVIEAYLGSDDDDEEEEEN
ncbi:ABC transporter ATP-binding protein [Seleniivibrio woodruffii]|uniref:Amino acid/amide ABC transporter ATP-binding protein 1 (HAAT family) n=1 Tax=Seleniivibrio woodruffii TaxID=1078050 RepID=A0A4R1K949_9BACT|nr:ABC transporter ATP-binding protein [Seleniivibrio woodruffii]TCK60906.1 amino acid/amide ABC transporter ATP-binding protein 1 (HAAT family) [Seleniivibrio woodruffii]TVZ36536.1 amino acid/amide ABC transporter ATP-binding protein 1 (HAAT family) [Seleniivibrio woodruffii]